MSRAAVSGNEGPMELCTAESVSEEPIVLGVAVSEEPMEVCVVKRDLDCRRG